MVVILLELRRRKGSKNLTNLETKRKIVADERLRRMRVIKNAQYDKYICGKKDFLGRKRMS